MMRQIGRIVKSHGTDGTLLIALDGLSEGAAAEEFQCIEDGKEPAILLWEGLPVPCFLESVTPKGNGRYLARLTGIHNLQDADEVAGKPLFLEVDDHEGAEENLIGWQIRDEQGTPLGTVCALEDMPGQQCLRLRLPDGRDALVPLHEDLILKKDRKDRSLTMSLPEGLLDL